MFILCGEAQERYVRVRWSLSVHYRGIRDRISPVKRLYVSIKQPPPSLSSSLIVAVKVPLSSVTEYHQGIRRINFTIDLVGIKIIGILLSTISYAIVQWRYYQSNVFEHIMST